MKKSNYLAVITGLAVSICIVTAFLPITASAELYAANGNPFTGSTNLSDDNPTIIKVAPPKLGPGTLLIIDPVTLPSEPNPAAKLKIESVAMQTVTGFLHRVSAIGGETTGWAIRLDSPLKLSATRQVNEIEVDADRSLFEPLLNSQVQTRGRIAWRQGIERGRYPVLMLEWIRKH